MLVQHSRAHLSLWPAEDAVTVTTIYDAVSCAQGRNERGVVAGSLTERGALIAAPEPHVRRLHGVDDVELTVTSIVCPPPPLCECIEPDRAPISSFERSLSADNLLIQGGIETYT